jgi:chromate transporter
MIEPLRRRVVEEKGWLSQREFLEGVAFCQVIPGATVVQLATYAGQRLKGVRGAWAAAAGFILPAFVLMTLLTGLYLRFGHLAWVKTLSRGLNTAVIALLLQALWRLGRDLCRSWTELALAATALGAFALRGHYLAVFAGAGLVRLCLPSGAVPEAGAAHPAAPPPSLRELAVVAALLAGAAGLWLGLRLHSPLLAQLAALMAKVGFISFGGGYVMIPVLQREVVEHLHWLTLPQFLDGILLSYVSPGPLIILAAFTGYLVKGLAGAAVATVAIFLPPILIVVGLSPLFQQVKSGRGMRLFIRGVLAALAGMLAWTILTLARPTLTDAKSWALMLGAAAALIGGEVNLLWVIGAVAGISLLIF